jgi:23S rRNA (guanosine2251-2'-O)-methyltransferase
MMDREIDPIYGRNPVVELMRAGRRRVRRILIAEGVEEHESLTQILELASQQNVHIARVPRTDLDLVSDHHQGVVAEAERYPYCDLGDLLERARARGEPLLVLLLDVLQDPQNLAVLLRTAEAVGVHGAVLPHRRSVGVTPAVVSASAGASEHLLIARHNIARAIRTLKQEDVWIAGLENSPQAKPLDQVDLSGPLGIVVGGEGSGMRRLVRESCDFLVRLPMRGRLDSLNAAVAGSIALFAAWQARGYSGRRSEGAAGR